MEVLEIHCKDIRRIEFQLESPNSTPLSVPLPATKALKRAIKAIAFPRSITDTFAFYFKVFTYCWLKLFWISFCSQPGANEKIGSDIIFTRNTYDKMYMQILVL